MIAKIAFIEAKDFVRVTPAGSVDLESSKRLLSELLDSTAHLEEFELLIDTRRVEKPLPAEDLWALAQHMRNYHDRTNHRTAVVCAVERFDLLRYFASCAQHAGLTIAAFTSYQEALDWLMGGARTLVP
jgi:hypothetical protein